jgi:hypothetical protein
MARVRAKEFAGKERRTLPDVEVVPGEQNISSLVMK